MSYALEVLHVMMTDVRILRLLLIFVYTIIIYTCMYMLMIQCTQRPHCVSGVVYYNTVYIQLHAPSPPHTKHSYSHSLSPSLPPPSYPPLSLISQPPGTIGTMMQWTLAVTLQLVECSTGSYSSVSWLRGSSYISASSVASSPQEKYDYCGSV